MPETLGITIAEPHMIRNVPQANHPFCCFGYLRPDAIGTVSVRLKMPHITIAGRAICRHPPYQWAFALEGVPPYKLGKLIAEVVFADGTRSRDVRWVVICPVRAAAPVIDVPPASPPSVGLSFEACGWVPIDQQQQPPAPAWVDQGGVPIARGTVIEVDPNVYDWGYSFQLPQDFGGGDVNLNISNNVGVTTQSLNIDPTM